jgi:hypothetical protein
VTPEDVRERLGFAAARQLELLQLNGGDLVRADPRSRQQLVQEFFFHLIGAVEMLAQFVNESRNLGLDEEDATARSVAKELPAGDSLRIALEELYANTRLPMPADPYSDEGIVYRAWNYRHQVTHRNRQPFQFNIQIGIAYDYGPGLRGFLREQIAKRRRRAPEHPTSAHFHLDPREQPAHGVARRASYLTAQKDSQRMLETFSVRCERALAAV